MYSYEDRIRAVRLYIKLGKRLAATIRRLGYPTKNSLKSWHREYEQCHDVRSPCLHRLTGRMRIAVCTQAGRGGTTANG